MWTTISKLTQLDNGWLVEFLHEWHVTPTDMQMKEPTVRHCCFTKREAAIDYIMNQLDLVSPEMEDKEDKIFERLREEMDSED